MDVGEVRANTHDGLERLHKVVGSLGVDDLERTTGAGWRVVGTLGHLAFWDEWVTLRLHRRLATGAFVDLPDDVQDLVNAAAEPLWHAVNRAEIAGIVFKAADTVAALVARLPDDVVEQALRTGRLAMVDRAQHWGPHLDDIEAVVRPH